MKNLPRQLKEYYNGNRADWTWVHAPINFSTKYPFRQIEGKDHVCRLEEDKLVKISIFKMGNNTLQGGSYLHPDFSCLDVKSLCRELFCAM
eukprot:13074292-Ditylum_brightwellii.AAC.1